MTSKDFSNHFLFNLDMRQTHIFVFRIASLSHLLLELVILIVARLVWRRRRWSGKLAVLVVCVNITCRCSSCWCRIQVWVSRLLTSSQIPQNSVFLALPGIQIKLFDLNFSWPVTGSWVSAHRRLQLVVAVVVALVVAAEDSSMHPTWRHQMGKPIVKLGFEDMQDMHEKVSVYHIINNPCLFFRYLASGENHEYLSFNFRVGVTTVRDITTETCAVLWDMLHVQVMPPPDAEQLMNIATEFYARFNFPLCLGAIDGKHIRIKSLLLQVLSTTTIKASFQ